MSDAEYTVEHEKIVLAYLNAFKNQHRDLGIAVKQLVYNGWNAEFVQGCVKKIQAYSSPVEQVAQKAMSLLESIPHPHITDADRLNSLTVGNRKPTVSLFLHHPCVVVLDDFLSHEECDYLVNLATPTFTRNHVVGLDTPTVESEVRTSHGAVFALRQTPEIALIEDDIATLINWPATHAEPSQLLRYEEGQQYKAHNDYFDPGANYAMNTAMGGQRLATFLMYLDDVEEGGDTFFPESGLRVKPKKGRALFFSYPQANSNSKTLHAGSPVISGSKHILVKWYRQRDYFEEYK